MKTILIMTVFLIVGISSFAQKKILLSKTKDAKTYMGQVKEYLIEAQDDISEALNSYDFSSGKYSVNIALSKFDDLQNNLMYSREEVYDAWNEAIKSELLIISDSLYQILNYCYILESKALNTRMTLKNTLNAESEDKFQFELGKARKTIEEMIIEINESIRHIEIALEMLKEAE